MPCHRPGQFALIGCRAGRQPAVPFRHALIEHEIGRHPPLCVCVLSADLLHHDRVVVGLARPLRKRRGTCAQKDDRRETATKYGASRARHRFNLINAPAIGAAVWLALLIDRHSDALVKSVRAFLKALDPTSILVGKFGRPPGLGCGLQPRSLYGRGACRQQKQGHNIGQTREHGFSRHKKRPSKMPTH
jgi:hypothetical protein